MSNADIMVEMIRLAEQIGNVEAAHMYSNGLLSIDGKTKAGKMFGLNLIMKEEEKNA